MHLRSQRKSKRRRGRRRPASEDSQRSREHGTEQREGIVSQCALASQLKKETAAVAIKSNGNDQQGQPRRGAARGLSVTHHKQMSKVKDVRNKQVGVGGQDHKQSATAQRRRKLDQRGDRGP